MLKRAEKGIYPKKEKERLPVSWQEKYCVDMDAGHFCVEEYLKYHIRFLKHNLLAPLPEKQQFDVIFCRNVMIYFDKTVREQLVRRLEDCLKEGGYLLPVMRSFSPGRKPGWSRCTPLCTGKRGPVNKAGRRKVKQRRRYGQKDFDCG